MATFDSGRQRYSMNFYASYQRPLQRRSYTGRPSRPAEGQLRVNERSFQNVRYARKRPHATWGLHAMTPSVRARTSGEARQVATAS